MSALHKYTKKELMTLITGKLRRNFGRDVEEATSLHMFKACAWCCGTSCPSGK